MTRELKEEQIGDAAWILERFAYGNPTYERNAAKRTLGEAMRTWPGDAGTLWWKWFNEAATSLGLRSKAVNCSVEEANLLASDGAQMMICVTEPASSSQAEAGRQNPSWIALLGKSKKRFEIALSENRIENKTVSARTLRHYFEEAAVDGKLNCVIMQPHIEDFSAHRNEPTLSPLERLRRLMVPEWLDIWIVIVFAFVVGLLTLAAPIAVEALVNTVAFGRFLQPIVILAAILLTFLGFQAAIRAVQTYVVEIIQRRLFARVAADLAYRLPRTDTEATDNEYMPELVNRFFDIVTIQKVSAQLLLDGLGLILSTIVGMAVLGFYHPWLLGFDVLLLASIAFIILVLGQGAVASSIKESKSKYYMAAWLEDVARCSTAFRNDGGPQFAMEKADSLVYLYLAARKKHFRILMRQIVFALGLQALASTVLLGLGGWLVVSGELTLGQLVAAELIVTIIVGGFAKMGKHMESFYDLLASVDKLGTLIDIPGERQDGLLGTGNSAPAVLELNSVSYSWPGKPATLDAISATVDAGTSLAIVGPSASGKSTLIDLIFGLRTPTAGHLLLDGVDPRDLRPDVLRSRVALVRGIEPFHATIEENIHLHRDEISAANVRDAMEQTGLFDWIQNLADGAETVLSSAGAPLTENQCRLLGLARAIVGRPGLLLIDGVLDGLSDDEADRILDYLLDPARPWSLIVATGRETIARRFADRLDFNPSLIAS